MKKLVLAILCFALIFALACNQQPATVDATEDVPAEDTRITGDEGAAQQGGNDGSNEISTDTNIDADASSEFKRMFSNRQSLQWQVSYDVNASSDGGQYSSKLTQYVKGKDRMRTDTMLQGMETRTYLIDQTFTVCTDTGNAWNCFQSEFTKDGLSKFEDEAENSSQYGVQADGTKRVAGVNARCYRITGSEDAFRARYCFSDDAVPLYIMFEGNNTITEMTATSYSPSVSDDVFEVPATANPMPSVPSGQGESNDPCSYCNYLSGSDKDECMQSCSSA